MRFGFVTSVQLGLSCMEAIYDIGGELSLAITLEDDQARAKSGRVYLDEFCAVNGIDLHKSRHINDASVIEKIKQHSIDWLFVIGWSQIASSELLAAPVSGVIGMHPTLLPQGRGRASIPWAILKKLPETGVTMFKVAEGVDTGPILDQVVIELSSQVDAGSLYGFVNEAHIDLIRHNYSKLRDGVVEFSLQDEEYATYWEGRVPEDGEIDLNGSVFKAELLIRAVTHPYPGAYFVDSESGKKTVVWKAYILSEPTSEPFLKFGDGVLVLEEFELCKDTHCCPVKGNRQQIDI